MKKHLAAVFLSAIFLAGAFLLLYPSVSDYWNTLRHAQAIAEYSDAAGELPSGIHDDLWADAENWNKKLSESGWSLALPEEELAQYESLLDPTGNGMMGYIEIPRIDCSLPICHGSNEKALQTFIGHIPGSSLPVGGENTHCVLSGHRGLPSSKLFTDLDQLVVGDIFQLNILGKTLTYEIDQILTVLPEDVSALEIQNGEDLCTLVTCTPYGVNTHRLLVRGHRIENPESVSEPDAIQVRPILFALLAVLLLLLILLLVVFMKTRKRGRR